MKRRILVTGSNGFVGKKLVEKLREREHAVRGFDLDKGLDLLKEEDCKKATKGIESVVHLAAVLDEHSPMLWEVNVKGTENILKASAENRVERFIHLSTAGIHGNQNGKVNEKSELKPVTDYEKSKAEAEHVVEEYQEMIHITILRPAIVLGPNEYWKKIVKLVGKNFPLIGSGKNKWQTVFIEDLVDAIVFCVEHEETAGETFIIAEEDTLTLEELCIEIKKALGLNPKMRKIPFWLGKTLAYLYIIFSRGSILSPAHLERLKRNREYSIEKIKKFGWKPKWNARRAVARTVKETGSTHHNPAERK